MTFCLCALLCMAINSPQNPPNILEAQKSSFTPPPVYTYPLDPSLYSYFALSATFFPVPSPAIFFYHDCILACAGISRNVHHSKPSKRLSVKWPRNRG